MKNLECLTASRDLRLKPCGTVPLASKQAYYKKLKLEPLGVECPQLWNSQATAVSVVGALAVSTGRIRPYVRPQIITLNIGQTFS